MVEESKVAPGSMVPDFYSPPEDVLSQRIDRVIGDQFV